MPFLSLGNLQLFRHVLALFEPGAQACCHVSIGLLPYQVNYFIRRKQGFSTRRPDYGNNRDPACRMNGYVFMGLTELPA